jgi:protein-S-isoprenylcysteine O-methyltransferase Ste14
MTTGSDRGTGWVVTQMVLLGALGALAPWQRGHWPVAASTLPGALLFAYAAWAGVAGVRGLGRNLTPLPAPRIGGTLVTSGIYARLRHPLYSSLMAMGLGWALLWSSVPGLVLAGGLCVFLHAKARHEEARLRETFTDYADYSRRVPRYLPRVRRRTGN